MLVFYRSIRDKKQTTQWANAIWKSCSKNGEDA